MSFKSMAIVTAIILFLLGCGYLFAGAIIVGRWLIEPTSAVLLLGRRMGAIYVGLSLMFFLARRAPLSVARTALSSGAAAVCFLLSMLGAIEFLLGRAGPAILASAAIEALLAVGFLLVLLADRRAGALKTGDGD